jgi:hypothetical protein
MSKRRPLLLLLPAAGSALAIKRHKIKFHNPPPQMPRRNKLRLHRLPLRPDNNSNKLRLPNPNLRNLTGNHRAAIRLMANNNPTTVPRHKAILNNNSLFIRTNNPSRQA